MHFEHAEHHALHRTLRMEPRDMARVTIVVRCGAVRKWRLRIAMTLMRIAGRLGGFKQIKLVNDPS